MAGTGQKAAAVGSSGGTNVAEPAKRPSSIKRLGMALKKRLSPGKASSQTAEEVPEVQPTMTKEAPSVVTIPSEKRKETEKVVEEPRKEEDHPKKRGRSQVPLYSAIGVAAAGIVLIAFKVATKVNTQGTVNSRAKVSKSPWGFLQAANPSRQLSQWKGHPANA